jgi:glycosyltransferase involved in cell wall biosynthesis
VQSGRDVCFLLPGPIDRAVGGYRIAFLYAERLKSRGWNVRVVIPHLMRAPISMFESLKSRYWMMRSRIRKPLNWFGFENTSPLYIAHFVGIHDNEVLVAVGADSMEGAIAARTESRTIHFVQGFENWSHDESRLSELYRRAARRVVISQGLWKRMRDQNLTATLIRNPVEPNHFYVEIPYKDREPLSIGFMIHEQPLKAWRVAWRAILLLKDRYPNLEVHCFGTDPRPAELPAAVSYLQSPDRKTLRGFYNTVRVFLAPSLSEGWGLTPSEAMQCGCCVVASDIDGHREFMVHEQNGLLAIPGDAEAFGTALESILIDPMRAEQLAAEAARSMQKFSMEASIEEWENVLRELAESNTQF